MWDNKLGQMEPATVVSVLPEFLRLEIATAIFLGDDYSFFAPFWPRCVVVYVFFNGTFTIQAQMPATKNRACRDQCYTEKCDKGGYKC